MTEQSGNGPVRRVGQVLKLRPEHRDQYLAHHAAVWPDVLALLRQYGIRNYSIFLHEDLLFSYLEYSGPDFDRDMSALASEETIKKWWSIMEPMQDPLP